MANPTAAPPLRRAHAVPTHLGLRRHRRDVARWALAHGHPVDRDSLAIIVAVRSSMGDGTLSLRWTTDDVRSLWWASTGWCLTQHVQMPATIAPTLGTYLRYLSAHRLFADGSDQMTSLRRCLAQQDLDVDVADDPRSRHPAGGRRRLAPVLPLG
ncbi:MAG: hypothetical protein ACYC2O_10120 [Microthrixaceae bacterium]